MSNHNAKLPCDACGKPRNAENKLPFCRDCRWKLREDEREPRRSCMFCGKIVEHMNAYAYKRKRPDFPSRHYACLRAHRRMQATRPHIVWNFHPPTFIKAMEKAGYSSRSLAEALNDRVPSSTIRTWMSGRCAPRRDQIKLVMKKILKDRVPVRWRRTLRD